MPAREALVIAFARLARFDPSNFMANFDCLLVAERFGLHGTIFNVLLYKDLFCE